MAEECSYMGIHLADGRTTAPAARARKWFCGQRAENNDHTIWASLSTLAMAVSLRASASSPVLVESGATRSTSLQELEASHACKSNTLGERAR
ncbi:MAG: hypothetical protein JWN04_2779 [Myxococcaceae bacterium]|nr:hypothetical protein [Myxococcaceae bacterium]